MTDIKKLQTEALQQLADGNYFSHCIRETVHENDEILDIILREIDNEVFFGGLQLTKKEVANILFNDSERSQYIIETSKYKISIQTK